MVIHLDMFALILAHVGAIHESPEKASDYTKYDGRFVNLPYGYQGKVCHSNFYHNGAKREFTKAELSIHGKVNSCP